MVIKHIKEYLLPDDGKWFIDLRSGLTVALSLIPESIAFALVAHLHPIVGLFSAFFMCFITGILGGRPGMISGATGAMAVVAGPLVINHGVKYLFATIILTGIFQIILGLFRLGKFVRIIPKPVMAGFINGLAIIIFISQLNQFKIHTPSGDHWLTGYHLYMMIGLVIIGMAVTYFLPKITTKLPSPLIAIIAVTAIVYIFQIDTRLVKDMMGGVDLANTLPIFAWIDIPWDLTSLMIVVPYATILTIIGLSEALMTLTLIDEFTNTRGRPNRECLAQGLGNTLSGLFQGMGGCAMIGQSMINIKSGGRGRLSGIIASVILFIFIVLLWSVIEMIPLAALVSVIFMVVIETFEWATFRYIPKIPKHDGFIIIAVTAVTVFVNLAAAVIIGLLIASVVFSWQTAKKIYTHKEMTKDGVKIYKLHGPLFFSSISNFKALFEVDTDPQIVIIDFLKSRVADHSAISAIIFITERYSEQGKKLKLRHLSPECKLLLGKACTLVETNKEEDPDYHVASNILG